MKTPVMLFSVLMMVLSLEAFGHGEDTTGPHRGFIRMPGAFHTEVLPVSPSEIQVFLLDINWKNPSTQNSSVDISFSSQKDSSIACIASKAGPFFSCPVPSNIDLTKKSKLTVKSKRDGQVGNDAIYDLPLKLQKGNASHSSTN